MVVDLREQVVEQRRHALDALFRRQVHALERVLDELPELRSVLGREAEHVGDDPHRDVLGVVTGSVDDVRAVESVDQRVAKRPGRCFLPPDRGLGEGRQQQFAGVMMKRRVGGDRRRAPDRRQVAGRPEVAHDDGPRREALGVVGDCGHVFVARRQPAAAKALSVRDRAASAQVVLDRVGISRPLGFQMREVSCPVAHRPGDDLAAGAERLLVTGVAEVAGEPVIDGHVSSPSMSSIARSGQLATASLASRS